MSTIAVIGPGAVGATVAGHLASTNNHSVVIAARTPFATLIVETELDVIRSTPTLLTSPASAQPVPWVLIATKAYDSTSTTPWIRALAGAGSVVAVLQNGVEHVDRFAGAIESQRILPVVVELPAHRIAPGHVMQSRAGSLTVPATQHGRLFADLFAATRIDVHQTDDFVTAAWKKLVFNATGAVTAATLVQRLDLSRSSTEHLVRLIAREAIEVARAEGAQLTDDLVDTIVTTLAASTSQHPNSLHADRLAGRPMEIEARNGAIVRHGQRHGIPTPVNDLLVSLLRSVDVAHPH